MKDTYSYIGILEYADDGISVYFPDLPGCFTCADTTEEAVRNAKEALGLHIWGLEQDCEPIPEPSSIENIERSENALPFLVEIFMPPVRERINNRSVSRTITLPAWLNAAALEKNINFSKLLQEALLKVLQ